MRLHTIVTTLLLACVGTGMACKPSNGASPAPSTAAPVDAELAAFIGKIRAVDNHTHVNTIEPDDEGSDALPLHLLLPFEIPVRLRETSPDWLAAYEAMYDFPLQRGDMFQRGQIPYYLLREGETEPPPEIKQITRSLSPVC